MLEQVIGHALRRFWTNARQAAQGGNQVLKDSKGHGKNPDRPSRAQPVLVPGDFPERDGYRHGFPRSRAISVSSSRRAVYKPGQERDTRHFPGMAEDMA
jgi:hypothetical protein